MKALDRAAQPALAIDEIEIVIAKLYARVLARDGLIRLVAGAGKSKIIARHHLAFRADKVARAPQVGNLFDDEIALAISARVDRLHQGKTRDLGLGQRYFDDALTIGFHGDIETACRLQTIGPFHSH